MNRPTNRTVREKGRRWLFLTWIVGSIALALYVAIAAPLVHYFDLKYYHIALAVPPLMVLMISSGVAWLVMLMVSKQKDGKEHQNDEP